MPKEAFVKDHFYSNEVQNPKVFLRGSPQNPLAVLFVVLPPHIRGSFRDESIIH